MKKRIITSTDWPNCDDRLRKDAEEKATQYVNGWGDAGVFLPFEIKLAYLIKMLRIDAPVVEWGSMSVTTSLRRKRSEQGGKIWRVRLTVPILFGEVLFRLYPVGRGLEAVLQDGVLTVTIEAAGETDELALASMEAWRTRFQAQIFALRVDIKLYNQELPQLVSRIVNLGYHRLLEAGVTFP